MNKEISIEAEEGIAEKVLVLRGQKVLLDKHLADLYGVKTIRLREQVKRNRKRFPKDFMFKLNEDELKHVVSHFAIPSKKYFGGHLPYVFTQEGVAMLSSVLNSRRAIEVNISIMRVFVRFRKLSIYHGELQLKIKELEDKYKNHDKKIELVFAALKFLLDEPETPKDRIGFHA